LQYGRSRSPSSNGCTRYTTSYEEANTTTHNFSTRTYGSAYEEANTTTHNFSTRTYGSA
jgi:hypothetical protein